MDKIVTVPVVCRGCGETIDVSFEENETDVTIYCPNCGASFKMIFTKITPTISLAVITE